MHTILFIVCILFVSSHAIELEISNGRLRGQTVFMDDQKLHIFKVGFLGEKKFLNLGFFVGYFFSIFFVKSSSFFNSFRLKLTTFRFF